MISRSAERPTLGDSTTALDQIGKDSSTADSSTSLISSLTLRFVTSSQFSIRLSGFGGCDSLWRLSSVSVLFWVWCWCCFDSRASLSGFGCVGDGKLRVLPPIDNDAV